MSIYSPRYDINAETKAVKRKDPKPYAIMGFLVTCFYFTLIPFYPALLDTSPVEFATMGVWEVKDYNLVNTYIGKRMIHEYDNNGNCISKIELLSGDYYQLPNNNNTFVPFKIGDKFEDFIEQ